MSALALRVKVGDRVRFDNKRTSWRVRAETDDGRYFLATASIFGRVYYTVVDLRENVRGAINVIGGGMSIDTTDGPDEHIDKAIAMLEGRYPKDIGRGYWEVSHRNRVPLNVTDIRETP